MCLTSGLCIVVQGTSVILAYVHNGINCNKFYCNLTFYKLNTNLILTRPWFGFVEQNLSTDKYFLKEIFLSAGDPLSAHVRTCAVLIANRQLSRAPHCIFGPQKTNKAGR